MKVLVTAQHLGDIGGRMRMMKEIMIVTKAMQVAEKFNHFQVKPGARIVANSAQHMFTV